MNRTDKTRKLIDRLILLGAMALLSLGYSSCATAEAASDGYVYICTGPKAKVYHSTPDCPGLSKCSGAIKKVKRSTVNRRGCRKCP